MSNDDKNDDSSGETTKPEHGFDLGAPSSRLPSPGTREGTGKRPSRERLQTADPRMTTEARPSGEWRGFEEEEEVEPEIGYAKKGVIEDELDMTPMVDVTFLLLIFFMVTASFTTQKSVSQPPLPTDEPSENVKPDFEDSPQYVEIIIDQYNSYRLTSKDQGEVEAPSDNEMRNRLRDMIKATMATRVVIKAHANCFHEKVVTAQDAALDNNIGEVSVQMTEEDFCP